MRYFNTKHYTIIIVCACARSLPKNARVLGADISTVFIFAMSGLEHQYIARFIFITQWIINANNRTSSFVWKRNKRKEKINNESPHSLNFGLWIARYLLTRQRKISQTQRRATAFNTHNKWTRTRALTHNALPIQQRKLISIQRRQK